MKHHELAAQIEEAFPGCVNAIRDEFIDSNPDLLELNGGLCLQAVVPAYMSWCVRNDHRPAELVHDYTLRALAEFGRSKAPHLAHLNFKHTCSQAQKQVVERYLCWCLNPGILLDIEQIQRSLKHWAQAGPRIGQTCNLRRSPFCNGYVDRQVGRRLSNET